MKTASIIVKSFKEQIRSYWVLILTLSMGPFFIFVYYLILESSKPQYDILIVNHDTGVWVNNQTVNYGNGLIHYFSFPIEEVNTLPFHVITSNDPLQCIDRLKNREADALLIIDSSFSRQLAHQYQSDAERVPRVEFIGDVTSTNYLISAVWANEILNNYVIQASNGEKMIEVKETALGLSGSISEFDMMVPGLLIVSLIMLMFTASIAFVSEIENKTIIRLKLSKITAFEFLIGISIVQLFIGVLSVIITLFTALLLGFHYAGSLLIMIFIASLTSLSIISFSLIIAALTKSANEVLVLGNFPMFLFMFFTGAAFPMKSDAVFTIGSYPVNIQGLMSPTHAISALNKTLIMDMNFISILPEMCAMIILTVIYFLIGAVIFNRRHLKLS